MKKGMHAVVVRTDDGKIVIETEGPHDNGQQIIINPEQVPLIVEWLQEAALELRSAPEE